MMLRCLLLLCLLFTACEQTPDLDSSDPEERQAALVAMAQSYHSLADLAVERDDDPGAQAAMRDLIEALDESAIEHRERTLFCMDAHSRLAQLQHEAPEEALDTVTRGLACPRFDDAPTLFEGYLLQTRSAILEALGRDAEAVSSHVEAIKVFNAIIHSASKE